jgi:CRISPR system Cascade subunit CasD
MKLLILRLEAPLMKWGLRSRWDERDTHFVPTKSGVVGLIACTMGIPRGDSRIEELCQKLKIGVRADRKGYILTDLQIVTSNSNPYIKNLNASNYKERVGEAGLVTRRDYLQDACFTVALSGDEDLLERIREALDNPKFCIYLGAKCCIPSRPVFENFTDEYDSIEDALNRYPADRRADGDSMYCEIDSKKGLRIRQDIVKNNELREYGFRRVDVKYLGG